MNERWYDKTVAQIEEKLNTDVSAGLSPKVLHSRQKNDRLNIIYPMTHHSFEQCFKKVISDPTVIILLIVSLIAAWLEQSVAAIVIITLVAFNVIVSAFSYKKSYQIFEDMGRLSMPTVKVMRNGKLYLIKSEQLVEGDVIFLSAGDMVPADARLVECDDFHVLEVNLTSEIKPIEKDPYFLRYTHDVPPAQQANMVFASTIVVKGSAKAVCCCIGEDTLVCKLKKNKPFVQRDEIKALSYMKKYSKTWSLLTIVLIFAIVILRLIFGIHGESFFNVFLSGLTLAAVATGEFHILSSYVIVANGLFSAVKQNKHINSGALIKNISKTEKLKDITCLLVHKEGAFSVKDIRVEKVFVNNMLYKESDVHFKENSSRVLRLALISTGLYGAGKIVNNNLNNENIYTPEEDAIISISQKCGVYNINLDKDYPILDHVSKGDSSKFETTLVNSKNGYLVSCRGELNAILSVCNRYSENGKAYPFSAEKKADIVSEAIKLSRKSYKIVAVSSKKTYYNNLRRIISCQSDMIFEGFIAIRERMLTGAAKNIADCQAAGIKVIMICDDYGDHNKALAKSLGIIKNADEMISGKELDLIKDDLFRTNVNMYKLYENISIYQKRKLLTFLKEEGETVGVLARNLEEIILLKEADVGFVQSTTLSGKLDKAGLDMAMAKSTNSPMLVKNSKNVNKTGSEALKFVADVIVSDADKRGNGGFNAIINAIIASKVIYKNLAVFIKYLLTTELSRFLIILYFIFTKTDLFTPQQVLFTGMIIDFISMIIIAFDHSDNKNLLKKNYSEELFNIHKSLLLPILSGIVWAGSIVILPYILSLLNINDAYAQSSVIFTGFIISQIVVLIELINDKSIFKAANGLNRAFLIMFVAVGLFLVTANYIYEFGILFGIVFSGWVALCISLIPSFGIILMYEIQKLITNSK